jgi:hypothetical protein
MNRGRVGEERGSKEMDGCPLTVMNKMPRLTFAADESFISVMISSILFGMEMSVYG